MVIEDITIRNTLINPFGSIHDQLVFLTPDRNSIQRQSLSDDVLAIRQPTFAISVQLAKVMKIMERRSYTFWDVLGDIGGFHDGLILSIYFLMAPFSAKSFMNKFAHDTPFLEKDRSM